MFLYGLNHATFLFIMLLIIGIIGRFFIVNQLLLLWQINNLNFQARVAHNDLQCFFGFDRIP